MSLGIHHFVFAPQIRGHDSNFSYNKFSLSQSFPGNSVSAMGMPLFRRQAASISGFDAEYPEQLLDVKRKQKRQSVAGIDQDDLLDPTLLADPDSCFCEFKGVQIHHKLCHEEEHQEHSLHYHDTSQQSHQARRIGFPIILLHGFGASVFSWNRVMKPLARVTGSQVLAFDRPAFGLTSRVNSTSGSEDSRLVNPYSMAFSVLATLSFIDLLATEKAIIIGHSAGSLVAVNTYFEAPERVAALILIAPATIAPFVSVKVNKMDESRQESQIQDSDPNSVVQKNPFMRIRKILSKLFMYVARGIMKMVVEMKDMIGSLFKKVLIAVLRSALAVMLVSEISWWSISIIMKFGKSTSDWPRHPSFWCKLAKEHEI